MVKPYKGQKTYSYMVNLTKFLDMNCMAYAVREPYRSVQRVYETAFWRGVVHIEQ